MRNVVKTGTFICQLGQSGPWARIVADSLRQLQTSDSFLDYELVTHRDSSCSSTILLLITVAWTGDWEEQWGSYSTLSSASCISLMQTERSLKNLFCWFSNFFRHNSWSSISSDSIPQSKYGRYLNKSDILIVSLTCIFDTLSWEKARSPFCQKTVGNLASWF